MLSIADALERIKGRVTDAVSEELIRRLCREAGHHWRDRDLGPVVTTHLFLRQVLHGNTAVAHLRRLSGLGYAASTSSVLKQTVQLAYTFTSLSSSANPSPYGQPLTFTASIMASCSVSGTVSFYDGTTLLATVNVSNNTAVFTTSALLQGSHSITAVYSGDADDLGSTSSVLDETIQ